MDGYQGIIFPARAEDLRQHLFKSYRVFLAYWDTLSVKLRFRYEELALSRRTVAVVIYGPQGSGKTLLADKLKQGLERAKDDQDPVGDKSNLWHRLTGGSRLDAALIREATRSTHLLHIEDDKDWVKTAATWYASRAANEHAIVVADNAERGYFLQGLLGMNDSDFVTLGRTDEAYRIAAERFVALARTHIRPALFLFLTNNEEFALSFAGKANAQHKDLVALEVLPFPSDRDKETAVRVNTNLLNKVTYWYCLDRAGPDGKQKVRDAIQGNETFPGSFAAVNDALAQSDRTGRPARKCVLSLAIFTDSDTVPPSVSALLGSTWEKLTWRTNDLAVEFIPQGWAGSLIGDQRRADLLQSEWSLRVVTFSNRLLWGLLDPAQRPNFDKLLTHLSYTHGTGTHDATMQAYWADLQGIIDAFPATWNKQALQNFWAKGQSRCHDYEGALRQIRPLYNTSDTGFLQYRPDLVVEPYSVCSVLNAVAGTTDAINEAIRRSTHVFEFTACNKYSGENIQNYLTTKVENYIHILEQQ